MAGFRTVLLFGDDGSFRPIAGTGAHVKARDRACSLVAEQFRRGDAQRNHQVFNDGDRRIAGATLNVGNVGSVDARPKRSDAPVRS